MFDTSAGGLTLTSFFPFLPFSDALLFIYLFIYIFIHLALTYVHT